MSIPSSERSVQPLRESTAQGPAQERPGEQTIPVTVSYLEIRSLAALRPRRVDRADVALQRIVEPWPELSRFLYTAVGADHYWIDRLPWTRAQWQAYLSRPQLEVWVLTAGGLPAGYFELEVRDREIEIAYFGLIARFVGQGLGGHLLTAAIERGFALGAERVWLHTCTLDHPLALPNYQARGMRIFRVETTPKTLPIRPPTVFTAADAEGGEAG